MTTPNWIAYAAIAIWPLFSLTLFAALAPYKAAIWSLVLAELLLPAGAAIKFTGIPPIDKISISNLTIFAAVFFLDRRTFFKRRMGVCDICLVATLASPFITAEFNLDPVASGRVWLPAESTYDALSASVQQFIWLVPFFVGRRILRTSERQEEFLKILTLSCALYSLLILLEVRMSPQLNLWLYGYYPTDFQQSMRDGGFRPMVFMGHGLLVALFVSMCIIAAATLRKAAAAMPRRRASILTAYLYVVLLLCKTLGAALYATFVLPISMYVQPRRQLKIAAIIATIAISYPLLRVSDVVPTNGLLHLAALVSEERAASLETRFTNESELLARAWQRPLFGWGRWGRSRIYNSEGRDVSITDGEWIILLGQFGLFGFLAQFGLLTMPIFRAAVVLRHARTSRQAIYTAGIGLILGINVLDLLPNSGVMPLTLMLAGSLLGTSETLETTYVRSVAAQSRLYSGSASAQSPI